MDDFTKSVIITGVLVAAGLTLFIRVARRDNAAQAEEERKRAADVKAEAEAQVRETQRRQTMTLAIHQFLLDQLDKWSQQKLIASFLNDMVRSSGDRLAPRWVVEAHVSLQEVGGTTQAEWRKAVHKFADALAAQFSFRLTSVDIGDHFFSLDYSEEPPNAA